MTDKMKRDAHHLWSAEADESGRRILRRSKQEPDMFEQDDVRGAGNRRSASHRNASRSKVARETAEACWGLFGASLCDSATLTEEIPVSVSRAFNAADRSEEAPRVHTWTELRNAFGAAAVQHARQAVSQGMKVRMASKYLNVPFLVAAELLDAMPMVTKESMKIAVDAVRESKHRITANRNSETITGRVAAILDEFGSHKIAVDSSAEAYWAEYYGAFGKEMVRDIKKRVRADLAQRWMTKNGVDAAAAEYWSAYFGSYADDWLKEIPRRISPSKK